MFHLIPIDMDKGILLLEVTYNKNCYFFMLLCITIMIEHKKPNKLI